MGKNTVFGLAGLALAFVTVIGCQSSDSGSGSRLLTRQSDGAWAKPPMSSSTTAMSGGKSLGISDTNNRPAMLPPSNGVQQTSAMQSGSSPSAGQSPLSDAAGNSNPTAVSGFDQGQVVSRPLANPGSPLPSAGPVPPSPPGGYTIPAPSAFTPPTNPVVPTRKPGDDS